MVGGGGVVGGGGGVAVTLLQLISCNTCNKAGSAFSFRLASRLISRFTSVK